MAGKVEVKYDSGVLDVVAVTRLIEDLGFGATLMEDNAVTHGKLDLTVGCLGRIKNVLKKEGALTPPFLPRRSRA